MSAPKAALGAVEEKSAGAAEATPVTEPAPAPSSAETVPAPSGKTTKHHSAARLWSAALLLVFAAACFGYYPVAATFAIAAASGTWVWLAGGGLVLLWGAYLLVTYFTGHRLPYPARVIFAAVILVAAVLFGTFEAALLHSYRETPAEEPDVLLILGALVEGDKPSAALRTRIDAAADYLREHPSVRALCIGSAGDGEHISEAECIREGLIERGIGEDRLLLEEQSATTSENLRFARAMLPHGVSVAVVTNDFHVFRAEMYARSAGFQSVSGLAAPFGGPLVPHYLVREFMAFTSDVLAGRAELFPGTFGLRALRFLLEIAGTVAFAISGAMTALRRKMDIFGVIILALTTAVGGGVIRDCLLGDTPPRVFADPVYALCAAAVAVIVFLPPVRHWLGGHHARYERFLLVMDSLGLGIFTAVGVFVTYESLPEASAFLAVFIGVLTAVGGGVMRDIFADATPYIFVKHVYAVASLAGAILYAVLRPIIGDVFGMLLTVCFVFTLRILSAVFRWNLPRCDEDL